MNREVHVPFCERLEGKFLWSTHHNGNWIMDTIWGEDDNPWSNRAITFMSILRLLIYNIQARYMLRRLRSAKTRKISWISLLEITKEACRRLRRCGLVLTAPTRIIHEN